jgi:hypothetical protein
MGLDHDGVLLILDSVPDRRAKRRVRPRVEPGRTPDRPKPLLVRMLLSFQRPVLPPDPAYPGRRPNAGTPRRARGTDGQL